MKYDDVYTPAPEIFIELVLTEISNKILQEYCIIQSFDVRPLQFLHKKYPEMKISYLSENTEDFDRLSILCQAGVGKTSMIGNSAPGGSYTFKVNLRTV